MLVAGEPGVGKTRLVAALARGPTTRVRWCCSVAARKTWPWPTSPSPRRCGRVAASLDPEVVVAHVAEHGGEIRRLVPGIEAAEPVRAESMLGQARLLDTGTDLLQLAAGDRPVVLVLDDLHWAAPSTIALLRHLLTADPGHCLCVLGTYRDTEVDRSTRFGGLVADMRLVAAASDDRSRARRPRRRGPGGGRLG